MRSLDRAAFFSDPDGVNLVFRIVGWSDFLLAGQILLVHVHAFQNFVGLLACQIFPYGKACLDSSRSNLNLGRT